MLTDCRSASDVAPHFAPPTDFHPESEPFVRAPFFPEQGDASHSAHCVPLSCGPATVGPRNCEPVMALLVLWLQLWAILLWDML